MSSYGEAKKRDMIRSVLPSTARKGARERLAYVKRANRTSVRQSLSRYQGYSEELLEDYVDDATDFSYYPAREINSIVWDRREADKVAPLMRWAVEVTKDIRQKDRLSHLRAMLPDSTIGRHAAQHVEFLDEFQDPDKPRYWYYYAADRSTPEEAEFIRAAAYAELRSRVKKVVETRGLLKRLNDSDIAYHQVRETIPHVKYAEERGVPRYKIRYDRQLNEWWYLRDAKYPLLGTHHIDVWIGEVCRYRSFSWRTKEFKTLNDVLTELGV